jgi:hypothetical protein
VAAKRGEIIIALLFSQHSLTHSTPLNSAAARSCAESLPRRLIKISATRSEDEIKLEPNCAGCLLGLMMNLFFVAANYTPITCALHQLRLLRLARHLAGVYRCCECARAFVKMLLILMRTSRWQRRQGRLRMLLHRV